MDVLDIRQLAEEWANLEDERDEAIETVRLVHPRHPRFPRLVLAAQQAEVAAEFEEDMVKYVELCDQLGCEADAEHLEDHGNSYEPTLIADDDFEDYARELAEDIGAAPSVGWPGSYIDWEAAADALRQDYTTVEYDGTTYQIRS